MSNNILLNIDYRPADSPWIETIWRSRSQQAGDFLSIALSRVELVEASPMPSDVVFMRYRHG
jgi:hypothetical protein